MKLSSIVFPSARIYYGLVARPHLPARFLRRLALNSTILHHPHRILFSKDSLASTLFTRRRVSSQTPISDPSRPDLFYHLISIPHAVGPSVSTPAYALSFLSSPPPSSKSATVIGWLPAVAPEAVTGDVEAGLNDFVENPDFRHILQEAVRQGLREAVDEVWTNNALQLQYGWMHIYDSRNIPALGRVGDPDDIIGSVLVEDSKILPDTYQAMPSYRLCTSDGPTQLTEGLATKLKSMLEDATSREVS